MDTDVWTIKAALDWTVDYLTAKGDEHPRRSAEWLLSDATGLSRVEVYAFHDRPLSGEERAVLREGVKRRGAGEPLQYVTGEVAFRHIVVQVERGVLIPRPETEMLVEVGLKALDEAIAQKSEVLACDLCTGSGVIALSLVTEREGTTVIATDISPDAARIARRNTASLHLEERVTVLECDLAEKIDASLWGTFDLVIANPPYIPCAELASLPQEVADFEPREALDGGANGLVIFERIADVALELLVHGGTLACELHEDCLSQAAQMLEERYSDIEIIQDLTGRDRIIRAVKP